MQICSICKKQLLKGQQLAVLSFPVECINNGGDYSFLSDFSDNEKVYHVDCFEKVKSIRYEPEVTKEGEQSKKEVQGDKTENKSQIVKNLKEALEGLDEDITYQDAITFVCKHKGIDDIGQLLGIWFESRNIVRTA
jgi:hypothetical protein